MFLWLIREQPVFLHQRQWIENRHNYSWSAWLTSPSDCTLELQKHLKDVRLSKSISSVRRRIRRVPHIATEAARASQQVMGSNPLALVWLNPRRPKHPERQTDSSAPRAPDEPSARLNYCARCNNQRRSVRPSLAPVVFMDSSRWHNLWCNAAGR